MRPIDADALKEQAYESREWSHGGHPFVVEVDDIDDAPTIDPDDLRPKGEWIEQEDFNLDTYYDCSVCGESFCLIDGSPTDNLFKFCPNCGAKMGGGE